MRLANSSCNNVII
ncbi:unnamed protein product, partial [Allacma fusca]